MERGGVFIHLFFLFFLLYAFFRLYISPFSHLPFHRLPIIISIINIYHHGFFFEFFLILGLVWFDGLIINFHLWLDD